MACGDSAGAARDSDHAAVGAPLPPLWTSETKLLTMPARVIHGRSDRQLAWYCFVGLGSVRLFALSVLCDVLGIVFAVRGSFLVG